MTLNQLKALKPGDRIRVIRYAGYPYRVKSVEYRNYPNLTPLYGVRLEGLWALYFASDIEHYTGYEL